MCFWQSVSHIWRGKRASWTEIQGEYEISPWRCLLPPNLIMRCLWLHMIRHVARHVKLNWMDAFLKVVGLQLTVVGAGNWKVFAMTLWNLHASLFPSVHNVSSLWSLISRMEQHFHQNSLLMGIGESPSVWPGFRARYTSHNYGADGAYTSPSSNWYSDVPCQHVLWPLWNTPRERSRLLSLKQRSGCDSSLLQFSRILTKIQFGWRPRFLGYSFTKCLYNGQGLPLIFHRIVSFFWEEYLSQSNGIVTYLLSLI